MLQQESYRGAFSDSQMLLFTGESGRDDTQQALLRGCKNAFKHYQSSGAALLGIMGEKGWAVEHLSKEHVADHIAQGSSG
ncbi:hypothetical protein F2P81_026098 [Scophthalmus maximus]|uniref:Uncharacterized protein n=1 Tax=Scophthalmus maximus TaxID=52904 RepID=A0A6A4RN20_SCOMX|nr:hypothetical protein F2P81_026098 [Scophthalmus maximus]